MDVNTQMLIWNTGTLEAFNHFNFDKILYPNNIIGHETYIKNGGKDSPAIDGYELHKTHKDDKVATVYFMTSHDVKELPGIVVDTQKVRFKGRIFNFVTKLQSVRITPQKVFEWRELIDMSGIPTHSNMIHWTLYKNKVLYGRLVDQFYYRTITESAFGKDKYKESIRLLLNEMCNISDPTVANLFYRACHNKDITICELPDDSNKLEFNKLCNSFMRIGDGTKLLDNRARSIQGTTDTAHIGKLSLSFIHNIPKYYIDKGKRGFDQIYPYNVINRYYYNLYTGFLQASFPEHMNFNKICSEHTDFIKDWIKSCLWWEENFPKLQNKYPNIPINMFTFEKEENRFRDHFIDFAKCLSYYAENQEEYLNLLEEEYKTHKSYKQLIHELDHDFGPLQAEHSWVE